MQTKAQGILASFGEFQTIVSLVVFKNVLHPLRETIKLLKRDLDIHTAYKAIGLAIQDMKVLREVRILMPVLISGSTQRWRVWLRNWKQK